MGKTSCAASLAVKFANDGYPTLIVSTDPAHSLSDSLDQVGRVHLYTFVRAHICVVIESLRHVHGLFRVCNCTANV